MSILGAKKRVEAQLKGKDPKTISYWFLDKALILLMESKVPKEQVLKHIDEVWK